MSTQTQKATLLPMLELSELKPITSNEEPPRFACDVCALLRWSAPRPGSCRIIGRVIPSRETAAFNPSPAFGLLLDVDGPIASPVSRTVAIASISRDLAAMANRGIPVIFNTGRSDDFIAQQVIPPLRESGLLDSAPVFTVSEKGAVWAEVTPASLGEVHIDEKLKLPAGLAEDVRELVAERFGNLMFFDETKRSMISVEQSVQVHNSEYLEAQQEFDAAIPGLLKKHRLGDVRIDPTIISTDIEHQRVGKDLGAERALSLLEARGITAESWFTMGDSRSDYAMATWLHRRGIPVSHVDVRPADGIPDTPYQVLTSSTGAIHDEAGAEFLSLWARGAATIRAGRQS